MSDVIRVEHVEAVDVDGYWYYAMFKAFFCTYLPYVGFGVACIVSYLTSAVGYLYRACCWVGANWKSIKCLGTVFVKGWGRGVSRGLCRRAEAHADSSSATNVTEPSGERQQPDANAKRLLETSDVEDESELVSKSKCESGTERESKNDSELASISQATDSNLATGRELKITNVTLPLTFKSLDVTCRTLGLTRKRDRRCTRRRRCQAVFHAICNRRHWHASRHYVREPCATISRNRNLRSHGSD